MPPVTLARVSLPVRSVTWIKVSFHVANIWQTANKFPETFCGPRATTAFVCSFSYPAASSFFLVALSTFSGFATSAINVNG